MWEAGAFLSADWRWSISFLLEMDRVVLKMDSFVQEVDVFVFEG